MGAECSGTKLEDGAVGNGGGKTVAMGGAGGSGSVFRRFRTVVCCSETGGAGGLCSVVCDVAEPELVDTFAVLRWGDSECMVHTSKRVVEGPGRVFRRFGAAVRCSEAGGARGDGCAICDVAVVRVGSGHAAAVYGASWDAVGDNKRRPGRP